MEYVTHEANIFARQIHLYDRLWFGDNTAKYICWRKDESLGKDVGRLIYSNNPDKNSDIVFEKTINPEIDPHCYVCIKCGNECREDLRGE